METNYQFSSDVVDVVLLYSYNILLFIMYINRWLECVGAVGTVQQ